MSVLQTKGDRVRLIVSDPESSDSSVKLELLQKPLYGDGWIKVTGSGVERVTEPGDDENEQ